MADASAGAVPVTLHIYDVTTSGAVKTLNSLKMKLPGAGKSGAYHAAVEVYGVEYSFGAHDEEGESGISSSEPTKCGMHQYREAIDMGETPLSEADIRSLIARMDADWTGPTYDLLRRNCCSFCREFCIGIGVGEIPAWVNGLAGAGVEVCDGFAVAAGTVVTATCQAAAAGGTALDAVDEKLRVKERTNAAVETATRAANDLNERHQISATVERGVAVAVGSATGVVNDLDAKHQISAKVERGVAAAAEGVAKACGDLDQRHQITGRAEAEEPAAAAGLVARVSRLGRWLCRLSNAPVPQAASSASRTRRDTPAPHAIAAGTRAARLRGRTLDTE